MMNRRTQGPKALSRLALSLLLGVQVAPAAQAQSPSLPAKPAEPNRDAAGGRHEGIKVHGHWVIDVRNPDGSLAQHRDFENALAPGGATELVQFLAGATTPGTWGIMLSGSPAPCGAAGEPVPCYLFEPRARVIGVAFGPKNVVVSRDFERIQIVLSGTATASQDTSVTKVATSLGMCAATASPTACTEAGETNGDGGTNGGGGFFTFALSSPAGPFTPVPVKPGQIIQVTVTISFS